jgi:hypothetical protein
LSAGFECAKKLRMLWKRNAFSPPPPINKTSLLWQSTHVENFYYEMSYACKHCWRTSSTSGWLHRTPKSPHSPSLRCFV